MQISRKFHQLLIYFKTFSFFLYLFTIGFFNKKNRGFIAAITHSYKNLNNDEDLNIIYPLIEEIDFDEIQTPKKYLIPDLNKQDGNVSDYEIRVIAKLIAHYTPKTLFEIGTFNGRTTLTMAKNATKGAKVYTLDLPPNSLANLNLDVNDRKYIDKSSTGSYFHGLESEHGITQLFGDSAIFDFKPFLNTIDFIFIDGSHSYDYVKKDTESALELLNSIGGIILWHDYNSKYWPGVTKALNEFKISNPDLKLYNISNTTLVILILKPI